MEILLRRYSRRSFVCSTILLVVLEMVLTSRVMVSAWTATTTSFSRRRLLSKTSFNTISLFQYHTCGGVFQQRKSNFGLNPTSLLQYHRHNEQNTKNIDLKRLMTRLYSSDGDNDIDPSKETLEPMVNVYQEWTLEQDQLLWDNHEKSVVELSSLLGRGLHGVQARLSKLKDVNSPAYERLFSSKNKDDEDTTGKSEGKQKLVPVGEILRRIQWDHTIDSDNFSILHYDRIDETIIESPWNTPNEQIPGNDRLLIDALPEHRIVSVKYKDRIVWDRDQRIDLVTTSSSSGGGIYEVIETYNEWKEKRDAVIEWNKQRQAEISANIERILGLERYGMLKQLSSELQQQFQSTIAAANPQQQQRAATEMENSMLVKSYVQSALQLFRSVRDDPSLSLVDSSQIPKSDSDALNCISELVALLPDSNLRPIILSELSNVIKRSNQQTKKNDSLPELVEDDIEETFVRGSGPGGQKVNKTSNRVVLVHMPTQLRVECQETRSLTQNRKIARKRLRLKLDDFYNGAKSRTNQKTQKLSSKKQKAKARSRARLRKKMQAKKDKSAVGDQTDDFY